MNQVDISRQLAQLDRELWLVTARAGNRRGGLISTTISSASIVAEMPRISLNLARQHHTWELVEASNAFALHLLGEEHLDWVWRFGTQTGRDVDKFQALTVSEGQTGSPLLPDARAWFECRVEARLDTGDRTLYLAEVLDCGRGHMQSLLTFKRLLQLAPADKLALLKDQLSHDAAVDAEAIRSWRQRNR